MAQKLSQEAYENKKRYIHQYDRTHSKLCSVKLRFGKDDDIIEYLSKNSDKSMQELFRQGMRELIKKEAK